MPTLYWPFSTSQVSEWPGQRKGSYHYGTDFAVAQGSILRATVDGVITRHNSDGLGAYVLDIMSDDGLLVRNGHLSRMDVSTGQRVKAGQVIGLTGGKPGTPGAGYSFGAHLHWELRRDRLWNGGAWIDPRKLNPQPLNFGQTPAPSGKKKKMLMIHKADSTFAVMTGNFWLEFKGNDTANQFAAQLGLTSTLVSNDFWEHCKRAATRTVQVNVNGASGTVDGQTIARAVNDEMARRMQS